MPTRRNRGADEQDLPTSPKSEKSLANKKEQNSLSQFEARVRQVTKVLQIFEQNRKGRVPYIAKGKCPSCSGTVHYSYRGKRAASLYCSNRSCHIRLLS